ncbi:MAG: hypothetical protein F4Z59_06535 [Gemmatimonadales bacterium]|nr:hypothetical protein [Gemmatimonadales bacterium]
MRIAGDLAARGRAARPRRAGSWRRAPGRRGRAGTAAPRRASPTAARECARHLRPSAAAAPLRAPPGSPGPPPS